MTINLGGIIGGIIGGILLGGVTGSIVGGVIGSELQKGIIESAKTESAKTESAKTESAKTESAKTESAKTESAKTESIQQKNIFGFIGVNYIMFSSIFVVGFFQLIYNTAVNICTEILFYFGTTYANVVNSI